MPICSSSIRALPKSRWSGFSPPSAPVVGYRRKTPWLAAAAGAFAPLLLIPLQSYGGELLLRLYLFSLPFAVCLVVLPLTSDKTAGLSLRRSLGLLLMGAVLATGTVVSRYGNDGMESFNDDEIAVVNHLYSTAPARRHPH